MSRRESVEAWEAVGEWREERKEGAGEDPEGCERVGEAGGDDGRGEAEAAVEGARASR